MLASGRYRSCPPRRRFHRGADDEPVREAGRETGECSATTRSKAVENSGSLFLSSREVGIVVNSKVGIDRRHFPAHGPSLMAIAPRKPTTWRVTAYQTRCRKPPSLPADRRSGHRVVAGVVPVRPCSAPVDRPFFSYTPPLSPCSNAVLGGDVRVEARHLRRRLRLFPSRQRGSTAVHGHRRPPRWNRPQRRGHLGLVAAKVGEEAPDGGVVEGILLARGPVQEHNGGARGWRRVHVYALGRATP